MQKNQRNSEDAVKQITYNYFFVNHKATNNTKDYQHYQIECNLIYKNLGFLRI
jgi:hypothetical protein